MERRRKTEQDGWGLGRFGAGSEKVPSRWPLSIKQMVLMQGVRGEAGEGRGEAGEAGEWRWEA